jgi:WD40 repeat protein
LGDKKGTIKVWDVRTGKHLGTVLNETEDGHKWSIKRIINSPIRPNEILIASALSDIRIFDLNSYTLTSSLKAHLKKISCLEFLTHKILLSSSSDLTIKIWKLETRRIKYLQTIECSQNEPKHIGKINETTFACLFDDGIIKIFHSDKESIEFKCCKTITSNYGYNRDLKVCSDLNLLLCAAKVIHYYSLSDFTCVGTLCPNASSFALSMDILPNNRLIVANDNNTLEIWCLMTGQSLSIHENHSSLINGFLFYLN